jgi:hypothetical protein
MIKRIKVPIVCGEDTCPNYDANGFAICHFLKIGGGKNKKHRCKAFDAPIGIVGGRFMRCTQCMQAEKK